MLQLPIVGRHQKEGDLDIMIQRNVMVLIQTARIQLLQTKVVLPSVTSRPSIAAEQLSLQSINNLFLHSEARFSQLTQQVEQTLRHAKKSDARRIADETAQFSEKAT